MKLLMCNNCLSVFSLTVNKVKQCDCGETKGKYIDKLNAIYQGDCTLIGFHNTLFTKSLSNIGTDFTAFTIKKDCKTFQPSKEELHECLTILSTIKL